MKILKYIVCFLLCLSFSGCGALQNKNISNTSDNNTSAQNETSLLKGTVVENTGSMLTVQTENGISYSIDIQNADLSVSQDGIMTGCPAEIEYTKTDGVLTALSAVIGEEPKRAKARDILSDMTVEEKVGQMLLVRYSDEAKESIKDYALGGFVLFAVDFKDKDKESVINEISSLQSESKIPLIISVDEEGGTVNRVSKYTQFRDEPFKSPQELYNEGGMELIKSDTSEKSRLLKSLGINLNLAPVCDVSENPEDYIYDRSFGKDAQQTSEYVKTVVETMTKEGIGCALKHFPGYGSNKDTHEDMVYDSRPYSVFEESDFLPFKAGISSGAGMVMVSHNIVECMDENYPASLSPKVHQILRDELGFNGVILTDELSMEAIKRFTGDKEASVAAVLAGNDLLCVTNYKEQAEAVIEAVKGGEIEESRIDESVLRILLWKIETGIIE